MTDEQMLIEALDETKVVMKFLPEGAKLWTRLKNLRYRIHLHLHQVHDLTLCDADGCQEIAFQTIRHEDMRAISHRCEDHADKTLPPYVDGRRKS